jgi:transposase InsO family protein
MAGGTPAAATGEADNAASMVRARMTLIHFILILLLGQMTFALRWPVRADEIRIPLVRFGRTRLAWSKIADKSCCSADRYWETRAEVKSAVVEWIEGWYNRERMHSSLGDISPVEFESRFVTEAN